MLHSAPKARRHPSPRRSSFRAKSENCGALGSLEYEKQRAESPTQSPIQQPSPPFLDSPIPTASPRSKISASCRDTPRPHPKPTAPTRDRAALEPDIPSHASVRPAVQVDSKRAQALSTAPPFLISQTSSAPEPALERPAPGRSRPRHKFHLSDFLSSHTSPRAHPGPRVSRAVVFRVAQ
jgi:hypothetical protein